MIFLPNAQSTMRGTSNFIGILNFEICLSLSLELGLELPDHLALRKAAFGARNAQVVVGHASRRVVYILFAYR